MSVTLTPPVRVFAFAAVLIAIGLAVFLFLLRPTGDDTTTALSKPAAPPSQTKHPATPVPRATPSRPAVVPASGFPLPIDRALRKHSVVVVVVYMPGAGVDAVVRREAKAGAEAARAGYVAVSALSERLVRPLVAKTGVLPDPAVVVIERPGVVGATLSVTDRETVAQAVAQARR